MPRKPFPSSLYPKATVFRSGPFAGVTDSDSPAAAQADRCKNILNAYRQVGRAAIRITGRPGFTVFGTQLDSGPVQWVGEFSKTGGTTQTVAICKGQIYVGTWGGNFAVQVTTANLTTASITLSASATCYCVVFANTLVISDGVNVPFTWDGTAGAGGLVKLTNCPVLYGQPVVYYFKVFGIKDTERSTMVWSEEGAANTGYEAGGYNNAWDLPGTKGEPLFALAARNDSLGVLRPRSTTTILGAVNDAFQTTGTRSSVSERTGTESPGGTIVLDEGTVTINADGIPEYWPVGGGYQQDPGMADDCLQTLSTIPRTTLTKVQWVYDPETNLIILGIGTTSTTQMAQFFCFERTGGVPNYVGRWTGFTANVMGMALDTSRVPRLLHGSDDGYVYYHGTPTGTQWNDNGLTISHQVTGPALGYDTDVETKFDEMTFVTFSPTGMTNCSVDYETTHGVPTAAQAVSFPASGFVLGTSTLGTGALTASASERRTRVGILGYGRWLRQRITHSTLNEQFGLELMTVTGAADGRFAGAA